MKRNRLTLLGLMLLLCFGLVACKHIETPVQEISDKPDPEIVMSTQYYDSLGNYIEIPMLVMPDGGEPSEAISAINLALAEIQEQYQVIPDVVASNQQCIFYPTETDRYINLLLFRTRFFTDLNTGHTVSFVYDKKENRQVTMEDALALVGLTEQDLFHALSAQYDPGYAQSYPNANICIQNHALEAFRLDRDDQPIFYLTARTDDADDTVQDAVSGANRLYIWADGVFTVYEQYNIGEEYSEGRIYPLVPAEETVTMNPPLWNQWYFSGDEPDGGFTVIPSPERTPSDVPLTYDIGKTLSELKNEYPEGEFLVSLDGFPDSAAACFGEQGEEYVYFFFGGHDGDFEKAMDECEDQLKCAGFITTANILFPDMEDDMSFEDFFSLIDVDDYEYFGEDTITAEGWLRFAFNGMEVMVNTNEVTADGGWDFTGAEIVKRNAPVSIVDPEILNTNQDLAEAVMFDQFDTSEETVTMDPPLWKQRYFSGDEPDGGFTVIPLPETTPFDEPFTYLREKMKTLAPNTPLVVDDIWEFNWNGTDAIVVHATNVEVTGDESTLYNPGGNHVAPNPSGTDNTVMYTMTTLFVDGCDPVELYYWAYPISSDPGGVSYLPATSGSFQQFYTVAQYAANGQPISCPVFMDHGGELVVRYFKYSPTYFQKDINADGIAEFIFSLDRDNSLMSHYQAYQMIDGAPQLR